MSEKNIYNIVKNIASGYDAIYEDYILNLVGADGLTDLIEKGLIESCGSIDGRKLYSLM